MYGEKITSLRKFRGLSQENLAQMLGIKQNALSDIENNKRVKIEEDLLANIAKNLGVTVEDIKNSMPIVMNFTTHDSSQAVGQQHNHIDYKITEALMHQLQSKDAQIEKLMGMLNTKK